MTGSFDIDELIVECVERCEREGPSALEEMCRLHPEAAAELREVVGSLLEFGVARVDPDSTLPIGTRIGAYEIQRELGRGGMGVVFEAKDVEIDRLVALKVMRANYALDGDARERFRREAAAAGVLQHENLVRVFGYGVHENHAWLAMERIEGAPLDRVLQHKKSVQLTPRELRQRVEIIIELGRGLQVAHEAGVVHRDVKPANILVRHNGSPVLTDFGLARQKDEPGLTQDGSFAGTPFYASPEQVAGVGVGPQSDVFSLGATLYQLLTLRRPFDGNSTRDVLLAIEKVEPADPSRLVSTIPEDLAAITLKALAKDPRERYATAAEFADDLQACLELRPVTARRATTRQKLRRWVRREPLWAALLLVSVVGLAVVSGLIGHSISQRPLVAAAKHQQRINAAEQATTQGFIALRDKDSAVAQRHFGEALKLVPDKPEAVVGLVMTEVAPRAGEAALQRLAPFLREQPDSPVLLRLKALCLAQSGRGKESEDVLRHLKPPAAPLEYFMEANSELRKVYPFDAGVDTAKAERRAYALLQAAIGGSVRPVPIYFYYACDLAGRIEGMEEQARFLARAVTRHWPAEGYSWWLAGSALASSDAVASRGSYEKAVALRPDSVRYRVSLARSCMRAGDWEIGLGHLKACEDAGKDRHNWHRVMSRYHLHAGDWPKARVSLQAAIRTAKPHSYSAWAGCVRLAYDMMMANDKEDDAVDVLRAASAVEDKKLQFNGLLVDHYLRVGDPKSAAKVAQEEVSAYSKQADPWFRLGKAKYALKDLQGAVEAFAKSCEFAPDSPDRWANLAFAHARKGNAKKALQAAQKSGRAGGFTEPRSLLSIATVYLRVGHLDDAERYFRMSLDLLNMVGKPHEEAAQIREISKGALQIIAEKRAKKKRAKR